ncbi:hypothetical protein C8F04DRAFT_1305271 [Mycena alexandri]|uniref:Uncharacterized protein n=1 Tax=Mycena alexandri TaxID=1745969 RepID=A0AAD6WQL9_9AGAR|nr:hypothetical protein C8F04DRAFT_1305271 [Mycena alexandri]
MLWDSWRLSGGGSRSSAAGSQASVSFARPTLPRVTKHKRVRSFGGGRFLLLPLTPPCFASPYFDLPPRAPVLRLGIVGGCRAPGGSRSSAAGSSSTSASGTFEAHAIGRNTRFPAPSHHSHRAPSRGRAHSRTPSVHRDDLAHASLVALNLPASTAAHHALPSINTNMNTPTVGGPTPLNTPAAAAEWRRPQVQRGRSASMESDRTRDGGSGRCPRRWLLLSQV